LPHSELENEATSIGTGEVTPADNAPPAVCPQCNHPNSQSNRFCASCGFKLDAKPPAGKPAAGKPAAGKAAAGKPAAGKPAAGKPAAGKPAAGKPAAGNLPAEGAATAKSQAPAKPEPSGIVLTALNPDGTEAGAYSLPKGVTTIGRDTGAIFAGDNYLSPAHATFTPDAGAVRVKDEASLNGVFRKLLADQRYAVRSGQVFRIGQELIRFEEFRNDEPDDGDVEAIGSPVVGYVGRICMVIGRDSTGTAFPVAETGLHLGRERGEVLFSDDGYVSGLHCRLSYEDGQVFLTDLGSSNGTFVRLVGEEQLANGDILLMGQQLFRVTM